MEFKLHSKFSPTGDQPQAIEALSQNLDKKIKHQTLWGVTGSGKTFTMANVIAHANKPTLVIAHNKTLAAQLADEFREFFPENEVHYFVSYYDYYQPEAYIPHTDTYIEKDSSINDEIDRLRHAATHALLTRKDVIIVASVSCIYGIGSPEFYQAENFVFKVGEKYQRNDFLYRLNTLQYDRNDTELKRGTYRLKGDILELMPAYAKNSYRIEFFGDTVERIVEVDWVTGNQIRKWDGFEVFPATHFLTPPETQKQAIAEIRADLNKQVSRFQNLGKILEAERIKQRTNFDLEMLEETGTCSGVENYSRYFDRRTPGEPSTTLIDYFGKDFLMFIDESHITVSQIGAMYAGDRSRKEKLVEYGFRLPSAFDNRPLKFNEFYDKINQVVFVSATPGEYEIAKSNEEGTILDSRLRGNDVSGRGNDVRGRGDDMKEGGNDMETNMNGEKNSKDDMGMSANDVEVSRNEREREKGTDCHLERSKTESRDLSIQVPPKISPTSATGRNDKFIVRQFIRPTGLLDPIIEVRPAKGQVENLIQEIEKTVAKNQRVLVTTLTKRMAEELTEFLTEKGIKVAYLHSDIETFERTEILHKLRLGKFDVLVGINLLREGLDLPEVSLVAILDADKEGFLRSHTSLIQTMGRAARHEEGRVIMYADVETKSMKLAIDETNERRKTQEEYNKKHGITPKSVQKTVAPEKIEEEKKLDEIDEAFHKLPKKEKLRVINEIRVRMNDAAKNLEFERAAEMRDQIVMLEAGLK